MPFYYPEHSMIGECTADGQGWDSVLIPILRSLFSNEKSPTIIEVGSNIGGSLIQMQIALPEAQFHCFEPVQRFYKILQMNIKENDWNNVKIYNTLLSDTVEEVTLNTNASTASVVVKEYSEAIPALNYIDSQIATSSTLDSLFPDQEIDFLKTDTDGYELKVFRGAGSILKRCKPYLFFEFDPKWLGKADAKSNDLLQFLTELGYEQFMIFSNFGEALAVERSHEKIIEYATNTQYYVDLLALPDERKPVRSPEEIKIEIGDRYTMYPSNTKRPEKKQP